MTSLLRKIKKVNLQPRYIAALFSVSLVILTISYNQFLKQPKAELLQVYADRLIETCSSFQSRQRCYDEEVPKLTDFISMEEAFKVIRLIQEKDDGYWFCHGAGHFLSAREYHKDPTEWKEVMTRCPTGICSNGCLHGAFQEHFSSEALSPTQLDGLMPDLITLCEVRAGWNPTRQEQASCYHELGHLSLYLTGASIVRAAEVCDEIGIKPDGRNYLETCYEGIFMQVFEPREPEDFALIYEIVPLKEKLSVCEQYTVGTEKGGCWKIGWKGKEIAFCNQFTGDLRGACFREAWVVDDEKIEAAEGIISYCLYSNDLAEKRKCYNKLYYGLMAKFEFDEIRMRRLCVSLPQDMMGQCFANTASRMIETDTRLVDRAIELCEFSATYQAESECYEELAHYASFVFHPSSAESKRLCELIPTQWSRRCRIN